MSDLTARALLDSGTVTVKDVLCRGSCRHRSAEECSATTHLVFPYRGLYLRHVGNDQSVADANHVLFFNAGEAYQVSHPVEGGDACLVLTTSPELLRELSPATLLRRHDTTGFRMQALRIDARAQVLVALLRHSLHHGVIEPLEAESLALTLICRSLGPRTAHATTATQGRQRLVDRVKVLLASDLGRRWSLAEIADQIGGSPVYLTQAFQQVEGLPLYRYHLRLRLARALDRVADCEDMSALAMDLGFSSHSHFAAAFKQAYGRTPTEFRASVLAKSA
ncbi:helix-turn-helix transcriptional regulator [Lysobacter arenosi]|jgi:AraC family transcriptional regulator|uniref:Helix-turn-helix transcriptional regulator n=1 Tax=Lysobacter arenosi TaxID=2795387 RepID=A0ABX7R9U7_9GAMM|nr:AraC family transcriptional regulator [Lysobacter arenosi]QSX74917.1 helix-turn-helix transcriptional regulator [Lysobacter arenosi]